MTERAVVAALREAGSSVATAESLTGGLVCATLVSVPGASEVVRGGVVAYASDVKIDVLGVDADLVAANGVVDAHVATEMAVGARLRLGATYGVSTTGVAGPEPSEGKPVGTVHVAVAGPGDQVVHTELALTGDRETIRRETVSAVLSLLLDRVREESTTTRR